MWILLRIYREEYLLPFYECYGPFDSGEQAEAYGLQLSDEGKGGTYSPMELLKPHIDSLYEMGEDARGKV